MHEGRHTGRRGLIMSSYVLQAENVALLHNKQSNLCFSFNARQLGRVIPQNINKDNCSKMWITKVEFYSTEITLHLLHIRGKLLFKMEMVVVFFYNGISTLVYGGPFSTTIAPVFQRHIVSADPHLSC